MLAPFGPEGQSRKGPRSRSWGRGRHSVSSWAERPRPVLLRHSHSTMARPASKPPSLTHHLPETPTRPRLTRARFSPTRLAPIATVLPRGANQRRRRAGRRMVQVLSRGRRANATARAGCRATVGEHRTAGIPNEISAQQEDKRVSRCQPANPLSFNGRGGGIRTRDPLHPMKFVVDFGGSQWNENIHNNQ